MVCEHLLDLNRNVWHAMLCCYLLVAVAEGKKLMRGAWERKGVGFLQSRGFVHQTPKRSQ